MRWLEAMILPAGQFLNLGLPAIRVNDRPPLPPRLEQPPASPWRTLVALTLAGLGALVLFVLLWFLTLGVMGPILAIGGGVFALAALHYLIWGRWLSRRLRESAEDDEDDGQPKLPPRRSN